MRMILCKSTRKQTFCFLLILLFALTLFLSSYLLSTINELESVQLKAKSSSLTYKNITFFYHNFERNKIYNTSQNELRHGKTVKLEIQSEAMSDILQEKFEAEDLKIMKREHLNCFYPEPWQKDTFMSCQKFHDFDLVRDIEFVASGGRRDVWRVPASTIDTEDKVILKTLRLTPAGSRGERQKFKSLMQSHRIESLALEQLAFSEKITNIHGYCSNSLLTDEGFQSLFDFLLSKNGKRLNSKSRFQLALNATLALSDVHNVRSQKGSSLIIHGDIRPWNYLFSKDNTLVLDDFNAGYLQMEKKNSPFTCPLTRTGW